MQEVTLSEYKSEFPTIENVIRHINEVISDENMIKSVDMLEENEEQIEIVMTINDYKNNLLVTSKLDKVNGFTVTIEDEKLSNLEILRIVENITRYMMYGMLGVIFITMLFNQLHLMNEKRSEYAQLKAFGYQSLHISIIIAVNVLTLNIMSYILAIIMTHLILKIDFSIFKNVNYALKLEMLGPLNIILDFLLIVIITIGALLMILRKIEQIEPMILLKKYQN